MKLFHFLNLSSVIKKCHESEDVKFKIFNEQQKQSPELESRLQSRHAPFVCAVVVSCENNPVMQSRRLALPEFERIRSQLDASPVRWSVWRRANNGLVSYDQLSYHQLANWRRPFLLTNLYFEITSPRPYLRTASWRSRISPPAYPAIRSVSTVRYSRRTVGSASVFA